LHASLLRGTQEEAGHDQLAAGDLAHLGLTPADLPEWPETAAYHQATYYGIDHDGPAALLGYFLSLEGVVARHFLPVYQAVRESHSPAAANFLRVHCELDVGHFEAGLRGLDALAGAQLAAVGRNILLSVALYLKVVERLWREAGRPGLPPVPPIG
jgi:hypothetical protein